MDPILGSSSIWVTPQARDLLQGSVIKCYVPGCESTFKNSGNLQMHLDKHHKIAPAAKKEPVCRKLYFCPQPDCIYNAAATKKHFKTLKYVRQHFQKVHAEKIFKCSKCSKSFGTAALRDFHVRNCGKDFSCKVCEWSYDSSEALLTHAKRKGHKINKNSNENSAKVAIPRLRNKSLASIVLEVTNCIVSDETTDGVDPVVDPADYADILEIPEAADEPVEKEIASQTPEATETKEDTEKSKLSTEGTDTTKCHDALEPPQCEEPKDSISYSRSLNTPPPCTGDADQSELYPDGLKTPLHCSETAEATNFSRSLGTPPHSAETEDAPSFSRVLRTPSPRQEEVLPSSPKSVTRGKYSPRTASPVHLSDPVDITGFSQGLETSSRSPDPVVPINYSVGLRTPPHCPEPVDSTGYSQNLKTHLDHPASLDSTIYCPGLTTPLHQPETVDPTSYSRCLETPRHCPEPDDDSNYSRDLETPPCIEAEDSADFSPVSPAVDSSHYSGAVANQAEETSKYTGGLETPPHCTEPITFTQPARTSSCTVTAETSTCIETQTESDPICIALPPKKRLKVATTPPLTHFIDPPFCDIETQTEFDLRTGPGDPMLYTDMHTQTCHEFLTELGLSDIQTQTNWSANDMDDGIQLSSTHPKRFSSGAYDELMVSTETQTSSTQCLLESCNEEDSLSGCITQHTQTCDFLLEGLFGGTNNDLIGGFQSSLRLDCFRPENNDR